MTQTASIFLSLSIALLAGLLLSRLAKKVQLPAVTAYLIAGILIGPFVLGSLGTQGIGITATQIEGFGIISDLALGFIAFAIGNEFRLSQLKKIGKQATIIGIFQALFTTVVVDAVLIGIHFIMPDKLSLPAAIVLASVATATAPAEKCDRAGTCPTLPNFFQKLFLHLIFHIPVNYVLIRSKNI